MVYPSNPDVVQTLYKSADPHCGCSAGTGHSSTGRSGTDRSGTGRSGASHSGHGCSALGYSGTGLSGAGHIGHDSGPGLSWFVWSRTWFCET